MEEVTFVRSFYALLEQNFDKWEYFTAYVAL